jgi:carbamoyltransferase
VRILGVSTTMDCGATLVEDGRVVAAVNEERFTRHKQQSGIPNRCFDHILTSRGLTWDDVDAVATTGAVDPGADHAAPFRAKERDVLAAGLSTETAMDQLVHLWRRFGKEQSVRLVRIPAQLAELRRRCDRVITYPHHRAHAQSAVDFFGLDDSLVLTADGWGEDVSSALWRHRDGRLDMLSSSPTISSLGYFYGSVTWHLGFTPHRHEGKVLGLAARGDATKTGPALARLVRYDPTRKAVDGAYESGLYVTHYRNPHLAEVLDSFDREDVAAGAQWVLEEVVVALLRDQMAGPGPLAVAGGVFANVRLNQRIVEDTPATAVHVMPHMGDGGLGLGAAALAHRQLTGRRLAPVESLYLGPRFTDGDIHRALAGSGLEVTHRPAIEADVARLVADGEVVARFTGALEWGPRALGNRSVLCSAHDPTVNDWLNRRLGRAEFMPFAPVTATEDAADFYVDVDRYAPNTHHMAVTVGCTDLMRQRCPACVHVDGTARPQLVSPEANPSLHAVLTAYRTITGVATMINTSFNMHEEPIVATPGDAVRALHASGLRYLAIGDLLAVNPAAEP